MCTWAAACALAAFVGFAPTYWVPLSGGAFKAHPIVHIYGFIFFAWTLFFLFQTWLAASGRIARHRATGLSGISFATAMTIFGIMATIAQTKVAVAAGFADAGKAFAIVPLLAILFFATVLTLAIANVRQPEVHKRLMLLASISILDAPIARWFQTFLTPPGQVGPPPVVVDIPPTLVACILLLIAMIFDWRTRGRPHSVYVIGTIALLAVKILQIPLNATSAWQATANFLLSLAG